MPTAPIHGTELYYETEGDGPWLVFAHGGEGTRLHWWQQVVALRDSYRCLTYDARGFGSSPVGALPSSVETLMADDLLALMDHVGVDEAVLVGHSMGGLAVGGVALAHPARVRALVMCDTPFAFVTRALSEWSVRQIERVRSGFDVNEHFFAPGFAERNPSMHYLYSALNRLNPAWDGVRDVSAYETWRDAPPGDYSNFPVPSLFLVGEHDELTDPDLVRATAEAVAGARYVEIPGAGHSAYAENPAAVNEAIRAFLDAR